MTALSAVISEHDASLEDLARLATMQRIVSDHAPAWCEVVASLARIFDEGHYVAQLGPVEIDAPPLVHYLLTGHDGLYAPHPLFDPAFYLGRNPDVRTQGLHPLFHYLTTGHREQLPFHPLFDLVSFAENERHRNVPVDLERSPLERYLRLPVAERRPPTRLVDATFYLAADPTLDPSEVDPFLHYLTVGHREGRAPSPSFDPSIYERTLSGKPRRHTLALADFALRAASERGRTLAFFDPGHYHAVYADLREHDVPAWNHYVEHGRSERRLPNALSSQAYLRTLEPARSFRSEDPYAPYFVDRERRRRLGVRRPRVVVVAHEASRTGAPAIALAIVRHLTERYDVECLTILDRGGPLVADFERFGHVYVKKNDRIALARAEIDAATFRAEVDDVLALFEDDPPVLALCNSAETHAYAAVFADHGIPTLTLVHEIAEFYDPPILERLVAASDAVICPAEFVAGRLRRWIPSSAGKLVTLPQGLLRETFGSVHWGDRDAVLGPHGVEPGDFVVLACGTADGRKGIDIFIDLARIVTERIGDERRIVFLWLGATFDAGFLEGERYLPNDWDSSKFWAVWDLREAGLEDRVRFLPSVEDPEAYFACVDVVVLTSRADPFPCIVHEAMACGLPVVAFAGAGGAPEALVEGSGIVVPAADRSAMADRILELSRDGATRSRIGEAARARVHTTYRFDAYVDRIVDLAAKHGVTRPTLRETPLDVTRDPAQVAIVFVVDEVRSATTDTPLLALARTLAESGREVEVLVTRGRFGLDDTVDLRGVRARFLQPLAKGDRPRQEALVRRLRERAPCVVVPMGCEIPEANELPAGIGVVGTLHDLARIHLPELAVDAWNAIVVRSDEERTRLAATVVESSVHVAAIPHGIPQPPAQVRESVVRSRSVALERLEILVADAELLGEENEVELVGLLRALFRSDVSFRLTVLGDGGITRRLARMFGGPVSIGSVELHRTVSDDCLQTILGRSHFLFVDRVDRLSRPELVAIATGIVPVAIRADFSRRDDELPSVAAAVLLPPRSPSVAITRLRSLAADASALRVASERAIATLVRDEADVVARYRVEIESVANAIASRAVPPRGRSVRRR